MGQTTVACAAQSGNSSCIVDILGPFFIVRVQTLFSLHTKKKVFHIYIYIYDAQINWKVEQAAVKKIKSFPQHRTDVSVMFYFRRNQTNATRVNFNHNMWTDRL
jgi:hypothetical protein